MATDTIKVNQSVETRGSSLKKTVKNSKNEEGLFGVLISSLLHKTGSTEYGEDDGNDPAKDEITVLLQGMASQALQPTGLTNFIFSNDSSVEDSSVENGQINSIGILPEKIISFIKSELELKNKGNIANEISFIDEGKLTVDNLSENILKSLEDFQQQISEEDIKNLSDSTYYSPEVNDAEILKNLLKKYSATEDNTESNDMKDGDSSQIEKSTLVFENNNDIETINPLLDKKGSDDETSFGSTKQNKFNDEMQDVRPIDLTDEKSTVMFKMPEANSRTSDLSGQTLSQTEAPKEMSKALELSQENIDKITKSFKTLRLPDSTEIRVKLTPEELGEVSVKVVLEKGHVTGHITAESKEVALMIENKLDLLRQEMANKNVNLSDISVSVFTGQGDGNSRHSSREFLNKHGRWTQNSQGYIEDTAINNDDDHDTGLNIIA